MTTPPTAALLRAAADALAGIESATLPIWSKLDALRLVDQLREEADRLVYATAPETATAVAEIRAIGTALAEAELTLIHPLGRHNIEEAMQKLRRSHTAMNIALQSLANLLGRVPKSIAAADDDERSRLDEIIRIAIPI